jgi:hypothetical protein
MKNRGRIMLCLVSIILSIVLSGCGKTMQMDGVGISNQPEEDRIVEIASGTTAVGISVGGATLQSLDDSTQSIGNKVPTMSLSIPNVMQMNLVGELSFKNIYLGEVCSDTPLSLNIVFNDVLKYSKVMVRIKTINNGGKEAKGLIGNTNSNVRLRIKVLNESGQFEEVPNIDGVNYVSFIIDQKNPKVINETLGIYLKVDFSNAVMQQYSANLKVDIVGVPIEVTDEIAPTFDPVIVTPNIPTVNPNLKPDLVITDVFLQDKNTCSKILNGVIQENQAYNFLVFLKNQGNKSVDLSGVKYTVGHNGAINAIYTFPSLILQPGQTITCNYANLGGYGNSPGTYNVAIRMDYYNLIQELDENNNMYSSYLFIKPIASNPVVVTADSYEGCGGLTIKDGRLIVTGLPYWGVPATSGEHDTTQLSLTFPEIKSCGLASPGDHIRFDYSMTYFGARYFLNKSGYLYKNSIVSSNILTNINGKLISEIKSIIETDLSVLNPLLNYGGATIKEGKLIVTGQPFNSQNVIAGELDVTQFFRIFQYQVSCGVGFDSMDFVIQKNGIIIYFIIDKQGNLYKGAVASQNYIQNINNMNISEIQLIFNRYI